MNRFSLLAALISLLAFRFAIAQVSENIYSFKEYNDGLGSEPNYFMFKNKLYYIVANGNNTFNLMQTDGTSQGTVVLSQWSSGPSLNYISSNSDYMLFDGGSGGLQISKGGAFLPLASQVGTSMAPQYYSVANGSTGLNDLWVTDGTGAGTKLAVAGIVSYTSFNGLIYFIKGYDTHLYKYMNGVATIVGDVHASFQYPVGFLGSTSLQLFLSSSSQMWVSDGNTVTYLGELGNSFGYPSIALDEKLYFTNNDTFNNKILQVTHGVQGDVKQLAQLGEDYFNIYGTMKHEIVLFNGVINTSTDTFIPYTFFTNYNVIVPDTTLDYFYAFKDSACYTRFYKFRADLSKELVMDLPGKISSFGQSGISTNGKTFFLFNDRTHGAEVWTTDGTKAGTNLLNDFVTTTSPDITPSAGNWMRGNGKSYFISSCNYYALWSLDSATNAVNKIYSYCESPIGAVFLGNKIYTTDHNKVIQIDPDSKAVTSTFDTGKSYLTPKHLIAGSRSVYYGAWTPDFQEYVYATHDGVAFDSIGQYDLSGAYVKQDTLYQLTKAADSLYLFRSEGISPQLKKIKGIDLAQNAWQAQVEDFGSGSVIISEMTSNSNESSFYTNHDLVKPIETDLGNTFGHGNNLVIYGDTVLFRVGSSTGDDSYYMYKRGAPQPTLLFTTPKYSHSSLIGGGSNCLIYSKDNYVIKYTLTTQKPDTLNTFSSSVNISTESSQQNGFSLLFTDDLQNLYFINTSKNIFLELGQLLLFTQPFLSSPTQIYYSTPGELWKLSPTYLVTGINESANEKITLYPNPSHEKVFLSKEAASVEVFSIEGTKMIEANSTDEVNISSLSEGFFIFRVGMGNGDFHYFKLCKK